MPARSKVVMYIALYIYIIIRMKLSVMSISIRVIYAECALIKNHHKPCML